MQVIKKKSINGLNTVEAFSVMFKKLEQNFNF